MPPSEELQKIMDLESKHFPLGRMLNFLLTLIMLTVTSMIINAKSRLPDLNIPAIYQILVASIFVIYALV